MNTKRSIRNTTVMALASAFLLAGCSDPAAPEGEGRVTATMSDSPSGSQVAPNTASGPQPAASSFQGQMQGSAQVYIYSDAHGWVSLGNPSNASLALQSSNNTTVHGQASVPAGSYTRVRLVLDGCSSSIASGSTIGGLVLNASVNITMGGSDGRVEIEKSVTPFTVSANSSTTIDFDLNSEAWVNEGSAQSKTASDAEIQSATAAKVHKQ